MAGDRTFGLSDRIEELGQAPADAYAAAAAAGETEALPPLELGVNPAPVVDDGLEPSAVDPDAALHQAAPGKFKPKAAAAPAKGKAPALAPIVDTGTLADTQEAMPRLAPLRPLTAPPEPDATFGELFSANRHSANRDSSVFHDHMLAQGYAPIVRMLGLPASENPAEFAELSAAGQARFGNSGSPSRLATAAHMGEQVPFGSTFLADRVIQETLIAKEIQKRRALDPKFAPGIPDTVDGLHKYFLDQQKKGQASDEATLARSPGGLTGFAAALAGSGVGTMEDPMNILALAIPGGEGKTILHIAARDALINGMLELGQQPLVAHNRAELGEHYGAGDVVSNTLMAAAGGAVLGTALHVGGRAAAATGIPQAIGGGVSAASSAIADKIFAGLPEHLQQKWGAAIVNTWARRLDNGEKLEDVFSDLSNRELTTLSRTVVGEQHLTPDERAAGHVLERAQEVGESSPYQPGPVGDTANENGLAAAIKDLEDNRTPEAGGVPSVPPVEGAGAAPSPAPERPPAALSTAERPQPAEPHNPRFRILETPQSDVAVIDSFRAKVGGVENNTGNIHAKNPKSSASGPAQFTDGTFREYYRKVYNVDPGEHPSRELKDNPTVQGRLLEALAHDNAAALKGRGEPVTEGNLYLSHFLGAGDALRVLKADASTPVERVLSEKVLEANPFLRGKSTSEVAAWAAKKMGGEAAAVAPRGVAGALDAAGEDPRIAQLNEEALQLEDQVIGLTPKPDGSMVNLYSSRVPVSALNVDAERFQFKAGGDQFGVNDRLRGVEEVDPMALGRLTLWQDLEGKLYVSDGHQRTGLLKREAELTGTDRPVDVGVLREADGVTAEDAMVMAALKNLGEDSGTKIDAAKIGRANAEALERAAKRLPKNSALIRDGKALAKLSDEAFGAVVNDVVPADYAAVIGHLLPDRPEAHAAMIDLLAKLDPANRGQAESIVRQALAAGLHKEEQVDLFGTHAHVTSLMIERAKVLEKTLAKLRKLGLVHKTAAEGAGALEAVGSKIAKAASEKEAQANAQALELVSRLAFSKGPIADVLNAAAARLAAGEPLERVADDAARAIRGVDVGALAGEAAVDDSSRLVADGAGRGGDAGEEGPEPPTQSGDQEQPSLIELDHATERFSDPDGPAVKQQAESLVHDFKAELSAEQQRIAEGVVRGGMDPRLARAEAIIRSLPDADRARLAGASLHDLGLGEELLQLHEQGLTPDQMIKAIDAYGTLYRGEHTPEDIANIGEAIRLMGVEPNDASVAAAARRDRIKAATAELEKAKPGELRTVEPHPEEPGYHRFRYVSQDGTAVTGNYTFDYPARTIEGFNIGDVHNRAELGPKELRNLFDQLKAQHPMAEYLHAYRKSGARTGEQEVWFQFTDKGVKYHGATDPRPGAYSLTGEPPPSTIVSPERFAEVWKDKDFKNAIASMTSRGKEDVPHRESPVAEAMVRGWIDGKKNDIARLRAEAQRALASEDQYRPHGYNPRQGYLEAFLAAATGKPREIRVLGSDRALGVREALGELGVVAPPREHRNDVVRFASGMSRKGDLTAGSYALGGSDKMGVGVEVGELSSAGIDQIARAIVDWKSDVFVDSGAFGNFRKSLRDPKTPAIDFDKVLAKYDEIEKRIGDYNEAEIPASDRGRLLIVMPDVVGDQAASLELLRKYAHHIKTQIDFQAGGTVPIVPLQKGELTLEQAFHQAREILGTDQFVVGIPSNEAALSTAEFRHFLEHAEPWGIHFLGASSEKTLGPKLDALNQVGAKRGLELHHLTADSNILRSKLYGRGDPGLDRPTAVMETLRKEDLAHGSESAKQYAADSAELEARKAAKAGAADGEPAKLDLGEQTDPAIADKNRQLTTLGSAAPMRSSEEQLGTMGLSLFDNADQPTFRLTDEGEEISPADLLAELDADDKAIKAIKDCL
jgi:hypothetical protein